MRLSKQCGPLLATLLGAAPLASADPPPVKDRATQANEKVHLGDALYRLEDLKGACQAYREATEILPTWWRARVSYVRCARAFGAPLEELLEHSQAAVRGRPDLAAPHYERALVLDAADRSAEAVAEYEQVLAIEPQRHEARYRLGVLLERRGEVPRARAELERVIVALPSHVMARSLLARLLEETGDIAGARAQLEALATVSRFPQLATSRLIRFLERHGYDKDAAALRSKYTKLYR